MSFGEVEKKLTFGRGAFPYAIHDIVLDLCAYGYYQRAADAAVMLGRVDPLTWDMDHMYIAGAMEAAYFFALRAGDQARAKLIKPWLGRTTGLYLERGETRYFPTMGIMDGETLKLPFDDPDYGKESCWRREDEIAMAAIYDLSTAAMMWNYGGSVAWPRWRIMEHVDTTIAKVYALDGWAPW
jgi:hypothetical protein